MTHRDFVYWLQGFLEVSDPKWIGEKETEMIKRHLALCFSNVTKNLVKSVDDKKLPGWIQGKYNSDAKWAVQPSPC